VNGMVAIMLILLALVLFGKGKAGRMWNAIWQ
jgi:hypothetical protein